MSTALRTGRRTHSQSPRRVADARQIIDSEGRPWGDQPELRPELLATSPAMSIEQRSTADWMTATSTAHAARARVLAAHDRARHASLCRPHSFERAWPPIG